MTLLVLGILVGGMLGTIVSSILQRISLKSFMAVVKKELIVAYEEGVKYGVVKPKIERVNEISKEQIGYIQAMDRPNASAAHARYKNDIVNMINQLEEEKLNILKSMLASGSDPILTLAIDGKTKNMRVSELVSMIESGTPIDSTPESKTDSNSPRGAEIIPLRLVKRTKENKDDGKPNPSDPKIH